MNRSFRAAAVAATALALAGCVDSSPIPTKLDTGVCFNTFYSNQGILQAFVITRCSSEHDAELLVSYEATQDEFDVGAMVTEAIVACSAAFTDYVGIDPQDSMYDYDAFLPTEEQWGRSERTVFCYAQAPADESGLRAKLKGSIQGLGE